MVIILQYSGDTHSKTLNIRVIPGDIAEVHIGDACPGWMMVTLAVTEWLYKFFQCSRKTDEAFTDLGNMVNRRW